MLTITAQLQRAFTESGWTLTELLKASRLDIDRSSLGRKLKGLQRMDTLEAEAIALALAVTIVWPIRRRRGDAAA